MNQHLLHGHRLLPPGQRHSEETGGEMYMGVCPRGTAKREGDQESTESSILTWSDQNCYFHLKSKKPCYKLFSYAHKDTDKSALLGRLKTAKRGLFGKDVFYLPYQRESCHFIFSWEYAPLDITLDYIYCRKCDEKIHLCPGPWSTRYCPQPFSGSSGMNCISQLLVGRAKVLKFWVRLIHIQLLPARGIRRRCGRQREKEGALLLLHW